MPITLCHGIPKISLECLCQEREHGVHSDGCDPALQDPRVQGASTCSQTGVLKKITPVFPGGFHDVDAVPYPAPVRCFHDAAGLALCTCGLPGTA